MICPYCRPKNPQFQIAHSWHGLPCTREIVENGEKYDCPCPTSFREPDDKHWAEDIGEGEGARGL